MPRSLLIAAVALLLAVLGLGAYFVLLKRHAEQSAQRVDTRPLSPPVAGPAEHLVLFIPDDSRGVLTREDTNVALPSQPNERAREVLHQLFGEYLKKASLHPVAPGAEVRNVYLLPGHTAVVDTTGAFADGHRSGVLVETLTVASMVETLAANDPGIARVKILVDGKERDTLAGHADLTCFYEVSQITELVKKLQ